MTFSASKLGIPYTKTVSWALRVCDAHGYPGSSRQNAQNENIHTDERAARRDLSPEVAAPDGRTLPGFAFQSNDLASGLGGGSRAAQESAAPQGSSPSTGVQFFVPPGRSIPRGTGA